MFVNASFFTIELGAVMVFIISFAVTFIVLPRIIAVVKKKGLMDEPDRRSSHKIKTPTFGGIAFFLSLIITSLILDKFDTDSIGINVVVGLTALFIIGFKDDLVEVSPKVKISAQLFATFCLILKEGVHLYSFNGFLGIEQFPFWVAVIIVCFIVLSIVNSYNLIDGINGSASMVGIAVFSFFGYIFYQVNEYYYFLLAVVSIAFLLAFLRYNLSAKYRIFMGDTGSMVVGFTIAILTLKYMALPELSLEKARIIPVNKLALIVAILFIPFVDTVRVALVRFIRHGRPFSPDRSHVHHVMIDYMNLSHAKASILLAGINFLVFAVVYFCNCFFSSLVTYGFLLALILLFVVMLFYFNRSYYARKNKYKIRKTMRKMGGAN